MYLHTTASHSLPTTSLSPVHFAAPVEPIILSEEQSPVMPCFEKTYLSSPLDTSSTTSSPLTIPLYVDITF